MYNDAIEISNWILKVLEKSYKNHHTKVDSNALHKARKNPFNF
jgi:hypothetical protein